MTCSVILFLCGCASIPYRYGRFNPIPPQQTSSEPVEMCHGQPNRFLDGLGNIVAIKSKILPMNAEVNNHHIADETLNQLVEYLEKNDITDVYVSVNEYAPRDQWRRLRENKRISPGWKYTVGMLTWLDYTILPKRVFGGDRYNPFTNSLYVNSNLPAVLIAEAAYAKDIHSRKYPGAYAVFVNDMPVLTIWRRCRAVNDVLGYARTKGDWDMEKQTYHVVYPQIGAATFGEAGLAATGPIAGVSAILVGPVLEVGGACVGHAVGRTVAAYRKREFDRTQANEELVKKLEQESSSGSDDRYSTAQGEPIARARNRSRRKIAPVNHVEEENDNTPKFSAASREPKTTASEP